VVLGMQIMVMVGVEVNKVRLLFTSKKALMKEVAVNNLEKQI
jgi:hypothetical protein